MLCVGEVPALLDLDLKKSLCKSDRSGTYPTELRPIILFSEVLKVFEGWMDHL